ncbi:unnamed protein product [Prunus armeniaca]|uniref:PA domain-containing protein n=1 Tax=Prunus armeniaca TaxID=36596 RepID=A0A6J5VY10_PRUAR|nr:unnamed protein product [Prunus armeniaca]
MASGLLRLVLFVSLIALSLARGGNDMVLDTDSTPKTPSCNNPYLMAKVRNWVNGREAETFEGAGAKFGALLPSEKENADKLPVVISNPLNGCNASSSKLSGAIALSARGDCEFSVKAKIAQSGGAKALVVINDDEGLAKMACPEDSTSLNISIFVVMIPKSNGEALKKSIQDGKKGKREECQSCFYSLFCGCKAVVQSVQGSRALAIIWVIWMERNKRILMMIEGWMWKSCGKDFVGIGVKESSKNIQTKSPKTSYEVKVGLDMRLKLKGVSLEQGWVFMLKWNLSAGTLEWSFYYIPQASSGGFSVVFLWLMAVGTIIVASFWSKITAPEKSDERYNELAEKESNAGTAKDDSEDEVMNLSVKGAVCFVITASVFLLLLYFFMSTWFVWVLIVLSALAVLRYCDKFCCLFSS